MAYASMAWCGTAVSPLLTLWRCCSLALGHQHIMCEKFVTAVYLQFCMLLQKFFFYCNYSAVLLCRIEIRETNQRRVNFFYRYTEIKYQRECDTWQVVAKMAYPCNFSPVILGMNGKLSVQFPHATALSINFFSTIFIQSKYCTALGRRRGLWSVWVKIHDVESISSVSFGSCATFPKQ